MADSTFDKKGGGTEFLGGTPKRRIVYDKAFLRQMKAITSIPFPPLSDRSC